MTGETNITLIGGLTNDPELKFLPSGAPVANFTVASTPRTFDKQTNEWKDGDTLFIKCAAWRQLAENVAESLQKGQQVIVTGALKIRNYERADGSKGTSVELNVDEIGPSLRFATAKVTRANRSGGNQSAPPASNGWGQQGSGQPPNSMQNPHADPWSTQPATNQEAPF